MALVLHALVPLLVLNIFLPLLESDVMLLPSIALGLAVTAPRSLCFSRYAYRGVRVHAALLTLLSLVAIGSTRGIQQGISTFGTRGEQVLLLFELLEILMEEEEAQLLSLDVTVLVVIVVIISLPRRDLYVVVLEVLEWKTRGNLIYSRVLHGRAMAPKRRRTRFEQLWQVADVDLQLTVGIELPELQLLVLARPHMPQEYPIDIDLLRSATSWSAHRGRRQLNLDAILIQQDLVRLHRILIIALKHEVQVQVEAERALHLAPQLHNQLLDLLTVALQVRPLFLHFLAPITTRPILPLGLPLPRYRRLQLLIK